jgi:protein gp37
MILQNNIGWTDVSANAVIGCSKVSTGCKNCFAATDTPARVLRSRGVETWGPAGVRHPVAGFAEKVRRLNKLCVCKECKRSYPFQAITNGPEGIGHCPKCAGHLRRIRLFADSNSDWLDDLWPIETLANFLKAIHDAPNVDFLLLTKRPENWRDRICAAMEHHDKPWMHAGGARSVFGSWLGSWLEAASPERGMDGIPPKNVWLGVSCENQEWADKRIPELLKIPAAVRFVSAEPLLSAIDFSPWINPPHWTVMDGPTDEPEDRHREDCPCQGTGRMPAALDWIIAGGESGPNFRPCEVRWITDIADQCQAAGVPVWVKQASARLPGGPGDIPDNYWAMNQTPKTKQ